MKITIVGSGYVGLVASACFSEMGNEVIVLDIDKNKISQLENRVIPIYEPRLKELVQKNIQSFINEYRTDKNLSFDIISNPEFPYEQVA